VCHYAECEGTTKNPLREKQVSSFVCFKLNIPENLSICATATAAATTTTNTHRHKTFLLIIEAKDEIS